MVSEVGTALDPGVVTRRSVTAGQNLGGEQKVAVESERGFRLFGKDGFSFWDFLDIVNPLQHIPIVGTLYRAATGDQLDPGAKLFGGALFGGPIGAALSAADVAVKYNTGKDVGEHALAFLDGGENQAPGEAPGVQTAAAGSGPRPVSAVEPAALAPPPELTPTFPLTAAQSSPAPAAGMSGIPEARTGPFAWADGNRALDEFYRNRQAKSVNEPTPDLGLLADAGIIRPPAASTPATLAALDGTPSSPQPSVSSGRGGVDLTADALQRLAQDLRAAKTDQPAPAANPVTSAGAAPNAEILQTPGSTAPASSPTGGRISASEPQTPPGVPADGWVFQAMVRALEKYQATGALPQAQRSPGVSVVR